MRCSLSTAGGPDLPFSFLQHGSELIPGLLTADGEDGGGGRCLVCKLIPEYFFTWEFIWFGLEQVSDTGFFILKAESAVDRHFPGGRG